MHEKVKEEKESLKTKERDEKQGKYSICTVCQKKIKGDTNQMTRHMKIHTDERKHTCPECSMAFLSLANMNRHTLKHLDEKPHTCTQCNKSFPRTHLLKRHLMVHLEEKNIQCQICPYISVDQTGHKDHTLEHKREKSLTCPECGKTFTGIWSTSHLNKHMIIHGVENHVHCTLCPFNCTTLASLKQHMRKHLRNDSAISKLVKCTYCSFTYNYKSHPDHPIDILIHTEGEPHIIIPAALPAALPALPAPIYEGPGQQVSNSTNQCSE